MSLEPKTNNWQPSASIQTLKKRADIIHRIRAFFAERDVLEVETPIMCHTSVTDPFIQSIPALYQAHPQEDEQRYYLQTSPEYAMKRLLAAGSGAIYQLSKTFRQGEMGNIHNPEFTMLEWYRPGYDHLALMQEVDELLTSILGTSSAEKITYADLFLMHLHINPLTASLSELKNCAAANHVHADGDDNIDTWLDILLTHLIEPDLGLNTPCMVYNFPVSQAALAKLQDTTPATAARFEVYYQGMELANGFHELQNADEQRTRFEKNIVERAKLGLTTMQLDEHFLAALSAGLPDCAGVALGVDRLVMLALGKKAIQDVISFDITRV